MLRVAAAGLAIPFLLVSAFAQTGKPRADPYGCLDVVAGRDLRSMHNRVKTLQAIPDKIARNYCAIAELMKRLGDYRAEENYREAIKKAEEENPDEPEPAYEVFFADYLRNFRGALHSLFPQAERHYIAARRKLVGIKHRQPFDERTRRRLERGLVALYQEDGLPLAHAGGDSAERPLLSVASINQYAELPGEFDRVDEVRSLTSEALFAAHPCTAELFAMKRCRLLPPLTSDQLRGITRTKPQYESLDRLRFRYKGMPTFDVFYRHRTVEEAQITSFFEPNRFNDVRLNEYGLAVEKSVNVAPNFDLFLRGAVKRLDRKGVIEFAPDVHEDITQYEANVAFSKYVGPDKVNLEYAVVHQDIREDRRDPAKRSRTIQGGKFTYQVFRPVRFLRGVYENRFETRGVDLFTGFLHDREAFGKVGVTREDFFFGASIKGIGRGGRMDVSVQPTMFTSKVEGDPFEENSQYRTNVTLLYRIFDEEGTQEADTEKGPLHLAFLHLVIPFKHDAAIDGPKDFENFRIGAELNTKLFTTSRNRTSFLLSARYGRQRFFKLDESRNLFSIALSMGF